MYNVDKTRASHKPVYLSRKNNQQVNTSTDVLYHHNFWAQHR